MNFAFLEMSNISDFFGVHVALQHKNTTTTFTKVNTQPWKNNYLLVGLFNPCQCHSSHFGITHVEVAEKVRSIF